MKVYMMTGFPGFLANRLIQEIIKRNSSASFVLLVHPDQMEKARQMTAANPQIQLVEGDITIKNLALSPEKAELLRRQVTYFFHLAAIYDLAVPQEKAYKVNVKGTEHVNQFVKTISNLKRYIYFSTAYVSGDREGKVTENELDMGQSFKNHYEQTKFEAEKRVAELEGVPVTIIRPGIVVGNSQTGETIKFDGPYFIMRFLDRLRAFPVPQLGKGEPYINIVPVDYIVDATLFLAETEKGANQTFHLTDPSPYRSREVYKMICQELLGKTPSWRIPLTLASALLAVRPIRRWFGVVKEALSYFECRSIYDNSKTQALLKEGGIFCPDLATYLPNLVRYYVEHRNDPGKKVNIS